MNIIVAVSVVLQLVAPLYARAASSHSQNDKSSAPLQNFMPRQFLPAEIHRRPPIEILPFVPVQPEPGLTAEKVRLFPIPRPRDENRYGPRPNLLGPDLSADIVRPISMPKPRDDTPYEPRPYESESDLTAEIVRPIPMPRPRDDIRYISRPYVPGPALSAETKRPISMPRQRYIPKAEIIHRPYKPLDSEELRSPYYPNHKTKTRIIPYYNEKGQPWTKFHKSKQLVEIVPVRTKSNLAKGKALAYILPKTRNYKTVKSPKRTENNKNVSLRIELPSEPMSYEYGTSYEDTYGEMYNEDSHDYLHILNPAHNKQKTGVHEKQHFVNFGENVPEQPLHKIITVHQINAEDGHSELSNGLISGHHSQKIQVDNNNATIENVGFSDNNLYQTIVKDKSVDEIIPEDTHSEIATKGIETENNDLELTDHYIVNPVEIDSNNVLNTIHGNVLIPGYHTSNIINYDDQNSKPPENVQNVLINSNDYHLDDNQRPRVRDEDLNPIEMNKFTFANDISLNQIEHFVTSSEPNLLLPDLNDEFDIVQHDVNNINENVSIKESNLDSSRNDSSSDASIDSNSDSSSDLSSDSSSDLNSDSISNTSERADTSEVSSSSDSSSSNSTDYLSRKDKDMSTSVSSISASEYESSIESSSGYSSSESQEFHADVHCGELKQHAIPEVVLTSDELIPFIKGHNCDSEGMHDNLLKELKQRNDRDLSKNVKTIINNLNSQKCKNKIKLSGDIEIIANYASSENSEKLHNCKEHDSCGYYGHDNKSYKLTFLFSR